MLELEVKALREQLKLYPVRRGKTITLHEALMMMGWESGDRVFVLSRQEYDDLKSGQCKCDPAV